MTDETTTTKGMCNIFGGFFPWWVLLIQGIIAVILGIFFLTSPAMTVIVLITFLGAYWFISGIFTLFSAAGEQKDRGMKILLGILGIILGLAILAYPFYSAFIVPFIFIIMVGVWALVIGAIHIYQGITGGGWGVGIIGLLSVLFGLILLVHPYLATLALPFVLGVLGIVLGFAAIIGAFMVRSKQNAA